MTGDHDDVRRLLGAYVLGGLDDADRRAVEEHLPGCEPCRSDLARSAPLPALLRRLPVEDALRVDEPLGTGPRSVSAAVLPGLLGEVDRDRHRHRRRTVMRTVLVAATVAALATAGITSLRNTQPSAVRFALTASAGASAEGDVELVAKPWGTALTVHVSGLPAEGPFSLEVGGSTRQTAEQAATWGATPSGSAELVGASSLPPGEISTISVLGPDGEVLAHR
ncbi:Putative zinc-finger [Modestobacter sp. DSM 44400]|uniref:zf-HC2 domain-containing protein n=1 Tax=Modestobacter sp. DSM 44400 TaxID=1550230 RepID=UPI00089CF0E4|nr:zf-HC2 domain-containing protein [Modestobacter sp. DSM 44400]SDY91051.1 Putative zinc-finger [Modestobacter sp. DSM 44400]